MLGEADRSLSKVAAVITVNRYLWRRITPERRVACADSLLRRIRLTRSEAGKVKRIEDLGERYRVEIPPCGEFPEIIQRHGLWTEDLAELFSVGRAKQMDLGLLDYVGDQGENDPVEDEQDEPVAAAN